MFHCYSSKVARNGSWDILSKRDIVIGKQKRLASCRLEYHTNPLSEIISLLIVLVEVCKVENGEVKCKIGIIVSRTKNKSAQEEASLDIPCAPSSQVSTPGYMLSRENAICVEPCTYNVVTEHPMKREKKKRADHSSNTTPVHNSATTPELHRLPSH